MAVLFDTAPLPPADRLEAFRTAMLDASGSTRIELDTTEGVRGQMALWSFGRARVFTAASTGISMSRDARAARMPRPKPWPSPCTAGARGATSPQPASASCAPAT